MSTLDMWTLTIESLDPRLTDLLVRLISGVLYTNAISLQNAEENILGERGLMDVSLSTGQQKDITSDPGNGEKTDNGIGNG